MPVFFVQWPADVGVEGFHGCSGLLGHMPHDGSDHFPLVKAFLAFDDVFG